MSIAINGEFYPEFDRYSNCLRRLFKRWKPGIDWAPKDLRNCILQYAMEHQVHSTLWEQYVGHAASTVSEKHYLARLNSITKGEEKALDRQMNVFRQFVVEPLEQGISRYKAEKFATFCKSKPKLTGAHFHCATSILCATCALAITVWELRLEI